MSLSLFIDISSKDWEIHGDGASKQAKFNLSGWPFNLDLSESPITEMSAFSVSGGGGQKLGTFTATVADDRILIPSHGLVNGDQVRFVLTDAISGALPTPLNQTTSYFVVGMRGNDFMVSLTSGGAVVNLTDKGIGQNEAWIGGSVEVLDPVPCKAEGSFITLTFPAPIAVGVSKIIRLKAKIGL